MTERDPSDTFRRRLEGAIPELIKRAVELGIEKAQEAPDAVKQLVADLKVPREVAGYIFSQIDETKNGLLRVVARETRDFLEHTNLAGELEKVLTSVQFEVNTTIRFRPNDGKRDPKLRGADKPGGADKTGAASAPEPQSGAMPRPEVVTDVAVKRADKKDKPPKDD